MTKLQKASLARISVNLVSQVIALKLVEKASLARIQYYYKQIQKKDVFEVDCIEMIEILGTESYVLFKQIEALNTVIDNLNYE